MGGGGLMSLPDKGGLVPDSSVVVMGAPSSVRCVLMKGKQVREERRRPGLVVEVSVPSWFGHCEPSYWLMCITRTSAYSVIALTNKSNKSTIRSDRKLKLRKRILRRSGNLETRTSPSVNCHQRRNIEKEEGRDLLHHHTECV